MMTKSAEIRVSNISQLPGDYLLLSYYKVLQILSIHYMLRRMSRCMDSTLCFVSALSEGETYAIVWRFFADTPPVN
jgi:hypothetical protein